MENWRSVVIQYNKEWDNQFNYLSGEERLTYIPANNISVVELKENIKNILDVDSVHEDYQMFYLLVSQTGRNINELSKWWLENNEEMSE